MIIWAYGGADFMVIRRPLNCSGIVADVALYAMFQYLTARPEGCDEAETIDVPGQCALLASR